VTPESGARGQGCEIGFYHLTRTGPEAALPQLLGRTLAAGQRAVVLCPSAERVTALDAALWQCADPDWLPHGTAADGDADLQPIWLTTDDASPNGARFLFLIDGAQSTRLGEFDRVFDLFDGNDAAAVAAARERWTAAKATGHALTYWQQGPRGWEKKA
jgi:DNA polymerase-3 subunit chi